MIGAESIEKIIASRKSLRREQDTPLPARNSEAEGGCGVIGMACNEKIPNLSSGRHVYRDKQPAG
jgi:hypothetical protein